MASPGCARAPPVAAITLPPTARDTFYARLIFPEAARAQIGQSFFDGGS
jgi:hypothetical protein